MRLDQSEVRRKAHADYMKEWRRKQMLKRLAAVPKCSSCKKPNTRLKQRYCLACHAAYTRKWRKTHPLNEEQQRKSNCRAYANVYHHRGHLRRKPCQVCGDGNSEKHHPDYARPLYVIWLCRRCHLDLHASESPRETISPHETRVRA